MCNSLLLKKMLMLALKLFVTQSKYINETETEQKQKPTMGSTGQEDILAVGMCFSGHCHCERWLF